LTISSTGTISGTPTVSGTFNYTVTIKDSAGNTGTLNCSVTVTPPVSANCVSITALKGVAITPVTLTATGGAGGPYKFSATGLPPGVTISTTGTISGTPTTSGTFSYTVTIYDKNNNKGTLNCSVTVNVPPPPVCKVYDTASPPYMTYQSSGAGIVRLDVTTNLYSNFNVKITPTPTGTSFSPAVPSQPYPMPTGEVVLFPNPVTGIISVSAQRINTSKSAQLTVKATDAAGQTVSCDPISTVLTSVGWKSGLSGIQTFSNLPQATSLITIENGNPGLNDLIVLVNDRLFVETKMTNGQVINLNVSKAMKPGDNNVIRLIGIGISPNSSAQVYISQ
jgi:hypothetical protein